MPTCIVVPGFLASTLYSLAPLRVLLWVNVPRLILGAFGILRLAQNGVDPQPPDGGECESGEGLDDYVQVPARQLGDQLAGDGYTVEVFHFDWRKEIIAHGAALAARVRAVATIGDPCALVCHSTGGLVARAAWANLGSTNQTALVRRIVTLGTPHQGTYAPVMVFSKEDALIRQLIFLNQALLMTPVGRVPGYTLWQPGQIRALAETWPALYQLFPSLPAPSFDPDRMALYHQSNWTGGAAPQQVWLDNAREVFWPLVQSPAATPPPWVLTTVSGTGWETRWQLSYPAELGDPDAIGIVNTGDGVVTRQSAEVSESAVYRTTVAHADQLPALVRSGQVADWVRAVRVAPSPPPPPEEIETVSVPSIQEPPITTLGFPSALTSPCSSGGCPC